MDQVNRRVRYGLLAANAAGAVAVFVLVFLLLPSPSGLHHTTRLAIINVVVFAVTVPIGGALGLLLLPRMAEARSEWIRSERRPSERERELWLRFQLTQQAVIGVIWLVFALVFGVLNAPFSGELAGNIAISIVLGGLVTCALGYLLAERLLRPITALVLSTYGVPSRPQLPGVAARALLSWTLGTGVVLLGIALIGIGGLHEKRFTTERLSIAILVLSVVGVVVGLATMLGLARSLAHPIDGLRRAVGRVGLGELDQEVEVDDGSEVGLLQAGFNQMLSGLREREHLRDLFGRQVGEDVVRHALEHGVELGGEARDAAVLFVDIEGSTSLAASRDPAEVVRLLNAFFAIVVDVVSSHRGWINKFEGDGALCVFGVPIAEPDAATHALTAARELRERLIAELDEISAGIGVSAGRLVAGNIGAARRFEYTVIGDPVNEASRLTELAKRRPERVLASESALARADPSEREWWLRSDELTLRGRSEPTTVLAPRESSIGRSTR